MKKNLIIIIVIIVVGALAYFGLKDTPLATSLLTSEPKGKTSGVLGRDINDALNKINTLRVDTSIFKNPGFQILRDYSSVIPAENRGRENPFLKIVPGAKGTGDIVVDSLNPDTAASTEPADAPKTTPPKTTGTTPATTPKATPAPKTTTPATVPATSASGSGSGSAAIVGSD